jgi:hypothetical protein
MLFREQTFKVTRTVHDSQNNNFLWVWLIEDKMFRKARDRYAASLTELSGTKVTR